MENTDAIKGNNLAVENQTVNLLAGLHEDFLLVGTTAPAGATFGLYLGLLGAELAMKAKHVRIISPDRRSAADKTVPGGIRFLSHLAMEAKKPKALILSLEPGLPFAPTLKKIPRALMLNTVAVLLKAFPVKVLMCDTPIQVPGGIGGRTARNFWTSFDFVIVRNNDDLAQVGELPYIDREKVFIAESFADSAFDAGMLSSRAYDEDLIASLSYDQVSYLLHLRANRARKMALAANDLFAPVSQNSNGTKAPVARLKSSWQTPWYIYNRVKTLLQKAGKTTRSS